MQMHWVDCGKPERPFDGEVVLLSVVHFQYGETRQHILAAIPHIVIGIYNGVRDSYDNLDFRPYSVDDAHALQAWARPIPYVQPSMLDSVLQASPQYKLPEIVESDDGMSEDCPIVYKNVLKTAVGRQFGVLCFECDTEPVPVFDNTQQ